MAYNWFLAALAAYGICRSVKISLDFEEKSWGFDYDLQVILRPLPILLAAITLTLLFSGANVE